MKIRHLSHCPVILGLRKPLQYAICKYTKLGTKMRYSFYYAYTIQSPRNYSIINKLNIKLNIVLNNIVNIYYFLPNISSLRDIGLGFFSLSPKGQIKLQEYLFFYIAYTICIMDHISSHSQINLIHVFDITLGINLDYRCKDGTQWYCNVPID